MSQSHFNYMNGVPVKIAVNYKPPKKVTLKQSVAQRLLNASNASNVTTQLLANCTYDFSLEHTVLSQISEWQHVRQSENCDRKERLRSYQQEHQKQIDAKQKQLLTSVSYPSTDDLSLSDEDSGHGTSSDASKSTVTTTIPMPQSKLSQSKQIQFNPPNYFDNILVPTVMAGDNGIERIANNGNVTTSRAPVYTKINFQEFESDTSSPFDNVELKTINDLDILAEVWNTSVAIDKTESRADIPASKIQSAATTK